MFVGVYCCFKSLFFCCFLLISSSELVYVCSQQKIYKTMKKQVSLTGIRLLFAMAILAVSQNVNAQSAMDFTMEDLDGNSHNLYSYLEEGKSVVIDFFQYECGPCYEYHETNELKNFYNESGPDGSDLAMVFQICTYDDATMENLTGDNGGSWNWIEGVPYPTIIIDPAVKDELLSFYQSWGTPTLIRICPDKEWDDNHPNTVGSKDQLIEWLGESCGVAANLSSSSLSQLTIYPVPANNYFNISGVDGESFEVIVTNSVGQVVRRLTSETDLVIDSSDLDNGMYNVSITSGTTHMVKSILVSH